MVIQAESAAPWALGCLGMVVTEHLDPPMMFEYGLFRPEKTLW